MRHLKKTVKLGRTSKHRESLISNLTVSLIQHSRITTTLAKAKAMRPFAEKLVTLGKKGELHHRRLAVARLHDKEAVKKLFTEIAPRFKERAGGYTRILKLGHRAKDAAPIALIEWVDNAVTEAPEEIAAKVAAATPVTEIVSTDKKD